MGEAKPTVKPSPFRWVVLFGIVIGWMLSTALLVTMVAPAIPILMKVFNISLVMGGLMMSVYSIASVIIALPSGIITDWLGFRRAGVVFTALLVIGWLISAVATNYATVLVGRFIASMGGMAYTVMPPPLFVSWFPPNELGLAMGIWASPMWIGMAWESPFTGWSMTTLGWRSIFIFGTIFSIIALAITAFVAKPGPNLPPAGPRVGLRQGLAEVVKNTELWEFGVTVLLSGWAWFTIVTYYVTWLVHLGYSEEFASTLLGIYGALGIFGTIFSGWLSDRLGRRKIIYAMGALLSGIFSILIMFLGVSIAIVYATTVLLGLFTSFLPPFWFGVPPTLVRPEVGGTAMGFIMEIFAISGAVGPIVMAYVYLAYGLFGTTIVLATLLIIAGIVVLTLKIK